MAKKSILIKKDAEQAAEHELEQGMKILISNPRKLLLGFTNPFLAGELCYHIAKHTNLKVLIVDADGLMPKVATSLGMKELVNQRIQADIGGESAFNMAMEYISRTPRPVLDVFKNIAVEHPTNKNLSVLTGNDDVQRYEDYSSTAFELLLKQSTEGYDFVAVVVPYNIYDAFYLMALEHVEYMIYGFEAYADNIMAFNSVIQFLRTCGRAGLKKHQYVPFNYSASTQMSMRDIRLAVDDQMLGAISLEANRLTCRNEFDKTYARRMSNKNINEYHRLAKALGYQTKKKSFLGRGRGQ